MQKEITVSISLLTSGRKKELEKCLQSLEKFRQAVSTELIIVDTGCDAAHRTIIEQYATRIVDFEWCDDFSKARNAGLEKACGEWFLYLDDDEWFEDMSQIIEFFRSGEYKEYQYAMYLQRNYEDFEGKRYTDAPVGRMIQLEEDTRFIYPIHECFSDMGSATKYFDDYVHHYGYVYANEEEKLAHAKRNIVPLTKLYEQYPENLRHTLQLMQEYSALEEYEKVRTLGQCAIKDYDSDDNEQIYYFNSLLVLCLIAMNKLGLTKEMTELGKQLVNHSYIGKLAEAYVYALLAYGHRELGQMQQSVECAGVYLELLKEYHENPSFFVPFETGILSPCFKEQMQHSVLENGIMAAISLGDLRQADAWNSLLEWDQGKLAVSKKLIEDILKTLLCGEVNEQYALSMCSKLLHREQVAQYAEQVLKEMLQSLPEEKARLMKARWDKLPIYKSASSNKMEYAERQEFLQLAEQIKLQVKTLIAQKRAAEAKQILLQLQAMVPGDEEVLELLQEVN